MSLDPLYDIHPSPVARCIFAFLRRRGGSVRLGPLLRSTGLDERSVADAISELSERYWITIVWRTAAPYPAGEEARPLTDIHRLCTTRFGRRKYRATWPVD
jgi:hypothetical protein